VASRARGSSPAPGSIADDVLAGRLAALRGFPAIAAADAARLGARVRSLDDTALTRINPFSFAEAHGFDPERIVDLFVHAVKVGLFDLAWNTVCVWCGAVEWVHDSLNALEPRSFHCTMCHARMSANLDERTEVTFSISASVRPVRLDPWRSFAGYLAHHWSSSFVSSRSFREYMDRSLRGHAIVPPDDTGVIELDAAPGEVLRVFSFDLHATAFVDVARRASARSSRAGRVERAEIDALPGALSPRRQSLAPGRVAIAVHNRRTLPTGVIAMRWNAREYHALVAADPPARKRYLTGKMLLNTQSFRTLFRFHDLDDDLRLEIKSLTLLFTDLMGSTALYERAGDATAFSIVRRHFHVLAPIIAAHRGAVVKTMGDAVMAAFSTEEDGFAAAAAMDRAIASLNRSLPRGERLALRIGLHVGPALAVNADQRIDYFGRTVNVAARVQAATRAGEICLTEPVYRKLDLSRPSSRRPRYRSTRESTHLKGIAAPVVLYRLRRALA
jgi:class 3 adenylate cyclase